MRASVRTFGRESRKFKEFKVIFLLSPRIYAKNQNVRFRAHSLEKIGKLLSLEKFEDIKK